MARVAFFSESLPSDIRARSDRTDTEDITTFSYDLMTSLADQQHDVRVFSTYREADTLPPAHPRLQILRPFRKWSWLELPRLVPILMDFQPEILHFIQPRKEAFSGLTNAMTALPSLAPVIGKPRVVVSLYDVSPQTLQKNRTLLRMTDAIVVANRQQADEASRWISEQNKAKGDFEHPPLIETVTLPIAEKIAGHENEIEVLPALELLHSRASHLILIPGELAHHQDLDFLSRCLSELMTAIPTVGVIFAGGWGDVALSRRRGFLRNLDDHGHGARFILTGPLSASMEKVVLNSAHLVLVAPLADLSLTLARWVRLSLQSLRPIVLSQKQSRFDAMNWRHRENSFLVSDDRDNWGAVLSEAILNEELYAEIRSRLRDFTRDEVVDQPGNAMSRIYAQVLRAPRKPLR